MPAPLLRRALASPWAWWAAAAAVAAVATVEIGRLGDEAEARRASWGAATEVVVATRDLAPGDVVAAGDVRADRWPVAVVTAGAVGRAPLGRTVVAPIVAGEVVVAQRLAPDGLGGVAALVPEGMRAVAVPIGGTYGLEAPPLAVGARVDVLATVDGPAEVVARDAVVVDVGAAATTVAVPAAEVADVAAAVARGTVTVALIGAG